MITPKLLPTAEAAKAVGVDRRTLQRWWKAGFVTPALVTPGGHARWSIPDLMKQLQERPPTED